MDRRRACLLDGALPFLRRAPLIHDFHLSDFPLATGEIVDHGAAATEPEQALA